MADDLHAEKKSMGELQFEGGRPVDGQSGHFGVSDQRRAELARMEREAGVQHEAADESVPTRPAKHPTHPETDLERDASLAAQPGAARPGDRH